MKFNSGSRVIQYLLFALLLALSVLVFVLYIQNLNWTEDGKSLNEMVAGTAHKPYVYRLLVPQAIRLITGILPLDQIIVAQVIMYASLMGFLFSFIYLYTTFWTPNLLLVVICMLALAGLLAFSAENKIYDLPGLFLFTLGLATLARGKIVAYLILFPIALFNKESASLLILVFAFYYYRILERRRYAALLFLQASIFLLIRVALGYIFRANPGSAIEFHLLEFALATRFYTGLMILLFAVFILVFLLVRNRFTEKPEFVQKAGVAVLPSQFILYWLVGFPFELRFFLESYPVLLLFLVQPLSRLLKINLSDSAI